MNKTTSAYCQLIRPANLITAIADILAGVAVSGVFSSTAETKLDVSTFVPSLLTLIAASIFLYAGGVALNDAFDAEVDRIERPERPIPSGNVSRSSAFAFGFIVLLLGCLFAVYAHNISGKVAIMLALSIIVYNSYSKHSTLLGPLTMGLCRGLNLLLGMTIIYSLGGNQLEEYYVLTILPVIYIAAITLISQGEVVGGNKNALLIAGFMYQLVVLQLIAFGYYLSFNIIQASPFILVFMYLTMRPLWQAYRINTPENIQHAVKSGVIAIIALDASIAAGFSSVVVGVLVILLLPLSKFIAKNFAVT